SDKPALEPYWGKPAVRNLRGDNGNVGIIRSPVRAIVLPDHHPVRQFSGVSENRSKFWRVRAISMKGRGIQWQACVTSKLAQDDRMLELAAESGCTMLNIGFESISRATLK